ncbi:MAG: tRNA (N6-threonylcarbamoyladenosine(37)-N6)-methyltransferase TrmO [Deltaproteobacteria bacterium]|nr:MAG: tRNA (N6-threonylcarbamoyladenosine(37)-N6)-methyltransferase TrmO [Deltaproteobacteria bacterium]
MKKSFQIHPVGWIHKKESNITIEIEPQYTGALLGMETFSHILVFYWFHENDDAENRSILQVRPRKNPKNPLTGVFATHAPVRPNLIAITTCKIESIDGAFIRIDDIDARDGSPVVDIKCYLPEKKALEDLKLPDWITRD